MYNNNENFICIASIYDNEGLNYLYIYAHKSGTFRVALNETIFNNLTDAITDAKKSLQLMNF